MTSRIYGLEIRVDAHADFIRGHVPDVRIFADAEPDAEVPSAGGAGAGGCRIAGERREIGLGLALLGIFWSGRQRGATTAA
ncbi:MAG: hypothetical protein KC486_25625 [Myxococcales bacterium]|nr:hypothetical protein [Myxococcales bacterium]